MVDAALSDIHRRTQDAVQMTKDEDFARAIEIFETALPRLTGGDLSDKRLAAAAFSYYGLCMAMVRRKYAQAVDFCNISLKANFMDPDHRYNLAMVYLERGDRRKAVETLNAGLRLDSRNRRLNSMLDEIGRRRPPVIGFLGRDNPINVWLGKMRHRSTSPR
jgi:tetratricopeptide (TPR) repeat protein